MYRVNDQNGNQVGDSNYWYEDDDYVYYLHGEPTRKPPAKGSMMKHISLFNTWEKLAKEGRLKLVNEHVRAQFDEDHVVWYRWHAPKSGEWSMGTSTPYKTKYWPGILRRSVRIKEGESFNTLHIILRRITKARWLVKLDDLMVRYPEITEML